MKRFIPLLITTFITLSSCITQKDVIYFPNISDVSISDVEYESPTIQPGDVMSIIVNTFDKELAVPYNLGDASNITNPESAELMPTSYLVDSDGYIDFPQLGRIKASGKTRQELANQLKSLISKFLEKPIVNIRVLNYRVTMLGEFNSPGIVTSASDKVNILEAIARAGDMSLYAVRDSVLIIRTIDNNRTHKYVNLQDANLINSEYFYLKPNDVIYALPSKSKSLQLNNGVATTLFAAIGLAATLIALFK